MTYDITTYEQAVKAVDTAQSDMQKDFPNVGDADVAHEAIMCVLTGGTGTIDPKVAAQLARRELGWDPEGDADLFKRHGLNTKEAY